jgi:hypothetical protein
MTDKPTQLDKFKAAARELEADDDPKHFKERLGGLMAKTCPECGHRFQGNGWDGIDAHWKAKHDAVMAYEEAWPLLKSGTYTRK